MLCPITILQDESALRIRELIPEETYMKIVYQKEDGSLNPRQGNRGSLMTAN